MEMTDQTIIAIVSIFVGNKVYYILIWQHRAEKVILQDMHAKTKE